MSGLATFFHDFIQDAYEDENTTAREPPSYETSLSDVIPATSDNKDNDEAAQPRHSYALTTKELIDRKGWREFTKMYLQLYVSYRFLDPDDREENTTTGNLPTVVARKRRHIDEEEDVDDESMFETQEKLVVETEQQTRSAADDDPSMIVPHVLATIHTVEEQLNDVNLLTKELTLTDCSVSRYWPLRRCRRTAIGSAIPARSLSVYGADEALPRLDLPSYNDDGPLSTCYRQVLSVEVVVRSPPAVGVRATASSAQRLHLFFYGNYAEAMEQLLSSVTDPQSKVVITLECVPAKCIFPHAPTDWYDTHNRSPCCVCVGDESKLLVEDPASNEAYNIRMDHESMRVYVGVVGVGSAAHAKADQSALFLRRAHVLQEGAILTPLDDASDKFGKYCPEMAVTTSPTAEAGAVPHVKYEKLVRSNISYASVCLACAQYILTCFSSLASG